MTVSAGRAGGFIDIEVVMDRYGLNLSAARVLKVIDRLVYVSRMRGVKDKRGIPYCYASKEWIAGQLGKSVRTIARAIRDLKAAGLIESKRTRSRAMVFITGYEVYETQESEAHAEAVPIAEATSSDQVAEPCHAPATNANPPDWPESSENSADNLATDKACPEEVTNGTSCEAVFGNDFAMNGTPETDQNVTSKILPRSYNHSCYNPSIVPSSRARAGRKDRMDDSIATDFEESETRMSREREAQENRWCDVHVALMERLVWQFGHEGINDYTHIDKNEAATIAGYVADAVAGGQSIRVNGASLSPESYWSVVKKLENTESLRSMLARIVAGAELGQIRSERAYILSAIYNCAMWQQCSAIRTEPDYDYWRRRLA